MNPDLVKQLNTEYCPSQFVSVVFRRLKKDLEVADKLTDMEWKLVEYLRLNLLLNFTGGYCRCAECLVLYAQIKAENDSQPYIADSSGHVIAAGKQAEEYIEGLEKGQLN